VSSAHRKGTWVVGVVLVTAAVSGYFMGLRQTGSTIARTESAVHTPGDSLRRETAQPAGVPVAARYADQDWLRDGPNARWQNNLSQLVQPVLDPAALTNFTLAEDDRQRARLERAARRAFDGAPPVVPHPIAQDTSAACLACHGEGLVIKDRVAPKISHEPYSSCTQCHAPAAGPQVPVVLAELTDPLTPNTFAAEFIPARGERVWPEAPPTIPHPTHMRSDCMSCHGPHGLFGLRTPHPDRQSCTQCHVPSADLDQHRFLPLLAGMASRPPNTTEPDRRLSPQDPGP
jgi:nitrate reductase (cytochrome), electron transfer subunit